LIISKNRLAVKQAGNVVNISDRKISPQEVGTGKSVTPYSEPMPCFFKVFINKNGFL
jgi:hypothetical protein